MHELSLCIALIEQIEKIARERNASRIESIVLQIGPLSGVEAPLMEHAYPLAAVGTLAEHAELVIESLPIQVKCTHCGAVTEALPNRLLCSQCGDFRTHLMSGDEMLLRKVEMTVSSGGDGA